MLIGSLWKRDQRGKMVVTRARAEAYLRDATIAIDDRDWAAFERLHHPDIVYVTPISRCVGRAAFRERFQQLVAAVPDLSLKHRTLTIEPREERAVFEAIQRGTLQGQLSTVRDEVIAPTRRPFELHSILVVTFDQEGLVTKMRSYFDTAAAQRRSTFGAK